LFPGLPSKTGLRRRGKKAEHYATTAYIGHVMADFSGYIAIDELYDGPYCILSIADNHTYRRLMVEVLDHNPTHQDIKRFLLHFRSVLEERHLGLKTHQDIKRFLLHFRSVLEERHLGLKGVTTDGSPLYPEPLAEVFEGVDHQICEFHVIKEINKEILKTITHVRRELKKQLPKLKRGRPTSKADRRAARRKKKIQEKNTE